MRSFSGPLSWVVLSLALIVPLLVIWRGQHSEPKATPEASALNAKGTGRVFNDSESGASSPSPRPLLMPPETSSAAHPDAPKAPAKASSFLDEGAVPAAPAKPAPAPEPKAAAAPSAPAPVAARAAQAVQPPAPAPALTSSAPSPVPAKAAGDARSAPSAATPSGAGSFKGPALDSSTAVAFAPSSQRDPFISPLDVQAQQERERRRRAEAEDAARRAAEEAWKLAHPPKAELPSVESMITLQGIISTPEKNSAIVNNEVKAVGEPVSVPIGEETVQAVITKITDMAVYFKAEGRTFKKTIQR